MFDNARRGVLEGRNVSSPAKYYGLRPGEIAARLVSDWWVKQTTRRAKPGARRKVVLVRLDNIGDFVLWQDTLRGWRALFPPKTHELTLIAQQTWASLAENVPEIDRVWPLDRNKFVRDTAYRRAQLGAVRSAGFAVVVQARPGRELLIEDAISRVSGAEERIGWARPGGASPLHRILSERVYSRLVPPVPAEWMELERNAALVRALGLNGFEADVPTLAEQAACPPELAGQPFYVLFPGADRAERRWPAARFAEIARRLHARTGWLGVVCGGPDDRERGQEIVQSADVPLEDWTGRTSLDGLAAIMRRASLVVSNETGGVHLAAGVGARSLCVTGGGHWGRFLPYPPALAARRPVPLPVVFPMPCFGCDWKCIYPVAPGEPTPCVENVSVDQVWAGVQRVVLDVPPPGQHAKLTLPARTAHDEI